MGLVSKIFDRYPALAFTASPGHDLKLFLKTCGQPHPKNHVAGNGDITAGAGQYHLTAIKEAEGLLREARRHPSRQERNGKDARSLAVLKYWEKLRMDYCRGDKGHCKQDK